MLPFLNLWLHILAAVIWIGGMLFLSLDAALAPPGEAWRHRAMRVRKNMPLWQELPLLLIVAFCLAVLILTGIVNVAYYGDTTPGSPYLKVLGIKLGLVAVLVTMGVAHDFIIGPRAARAQSRDGLLPTGADLLMVQLAPWVGRLNLLLGVIILVLAAALTRSH